MIQTIFLYPCLEEQLSSTQNADMDHLNNNNFDHLALQFSNKYTKILEAWNALPEILESENTQTCIPVKFTNGNTKNQDIIGNGIHINGNGTHNGHSNIQHVNAKIESILQQKTRIKADKNVCIEELENAVHNFVFSMPFRKKISFSQQRSTVKKSMYDILLLKLLFDGKFEKLKTAEEFQEQTYQIMSIISNITSNQEAVKSNEIENSDSIFSKISQGIRMINESNLSEYQFVILTCCIVLYRMSSLDPFLRDNMNLYIDQIKFLLFKNLKKNDKGELLIIICENFISEMNNCTFVKLRIDEVDDCYADKDIPIESICNTHTTNSSENEGCGLTNGSIKVPLTNGANHRRVRSHTMDLSLLRNVNKKLICENGNGVRRHSISDTKSILRNALNKPPQNYFNIKLLKEGHFVSKDMIKTLDKEKIVQGYLDNGNMHVFGDFPVDLSVTKLDKSDSDSIRHSSMNGKYSQDSNDTVCVTVNSSLSTSSLNLQNTSGSESTFKLPLDKAEYYPAIMPHFAKKENNHQKRGVFVNNPPHIKNSSSVHSEPLPKRPKIQKGANSEVFLDSANANKYTNSTSIKPLFNYANNNFNQMEDVNYQLEFKHRLFKALLNPESDDSNSNFVNFLTHYPEYLSILQIAAYNKMFITEKKNSNNGIDKADVPQLRKMLNSESIQNEVKKKKAGGTYFFVKQLLNNPQLGYVTEKVHPIVIYDNQMYPFISIHNKLGHVVNLNVGGKFWTCRKFYPPSSTSSLASVNPEDLSLKLHSFNSNSGVQSNFSSNTVSNLENGSNSADTSIKHSDSVRKRRNGAKIIRSLLNRPFVDPKKLQLLNPQMKILNKITPDDSTLWTSN
ncbi:hypothetical protein A3Q56_00812 [Intoshia linei]|uniref:Uncharacterized protein n=1 Tax=Intoshia linei TaxID=1819745 RepID=A0A177BD17_9BILA|nr:hypothetical protein A3Q56_00812 [Intoshia linei]